MQGTHANACQTDRLCSVRLELLNLRVDAQVFPRCQNANLGVVASRLELLHSLRELRVGSRSVNDARNAWWPTSTATCTRSTPRLELSTSTRTPPRCLGELGFESPLEIGSGAVVIDNSAASTVGSCSASPGAAPTVGRVVPYCRTVGARVELSKREFRATPRQCRAQQAQGLPGSCWALEDGVGSLLKRLYDLLHVHQLHIVPGVSRARLKMLV
jgi:hypothetical protein